MPRHDPDRPYHIAIGLLVAGIALAVVGGLIQAIAIIGGAS